MSTAILAKKLLTIKMDRGEFKKIKWLQMHNIQKRRVTVDSLRRILDQQTQNETCRLCLNIGGAKIFGGNQDFDVASNIRYILGIEIKEDDGKPQHICNSCEDTVRAVIRLKETAETTQWRLQQELDMVEESTSDWSVEGTIKSHGGYFETRGVDITREWTCGKCKRNFMTLEEFAEHEKMAVCRSKSRYYVCETCGIELKSMSRLNRHRLTHTDELKYICPHCPYRARTKYALCVHERSHSGARPVRCPHCPAAFSNASNLASHRRRHLPPRYHCDVCARGFKFKQTLHNHIATQHSTAKPFTCNSCGKPFSTRKLILRHELKVHNRPKMRSGIIPSYIRLQQDEYNT